MAQIEVIYIGVVIILCGTYLLKGPFTQKSSKSKLFFTTEIFKTRVAGILIVTCLFLYLKILTY